jgi:hypothetical protein
MKNKIALWLFCLPLIALGLALSSFDGGTTTSESSEIQASSGVGQYSAFNFRLDTLTNTEANILTVGRRDNSIWNTVTNPTNFLSLYTFDVKVRTASISGTHSVKVVLDGSNVTSGVSNGWVGLDSLTTTTSNTIQLRTNDATATRYRLRVSGTGTMVSTYQIWCFAKKKN